MTAQIADACREKCFYGTCEGGPNPCGGCCRCLGPCVVAYEESMEPYVAPTAGAS